MALARKLTSKIYDIRAHSQKVTCLDLGETGRVLVTGGQDRNVNLWAFGNEKCFMSLSGHNGQIDCVKFAYNDNYVYSADENGIIKRWDLNAQGNCTTFYGHMKSVRTLDFHPYGEYVASGSNDTTVRLWDVRKNNACIDKYRGHIANVNSVKFSPDGSWIASAGTEGSVIIWDIRMRKKIIEFQEHASPVTCIQFHPFEFLLAAGRNDGTVDLYDLESKKLISRTDQNSPFNGHVVKCITFSDNGECLFVGTAEGISVIGWEPDRKFDHIDSTWSILGDMKVVNNQLFCGSYENQQVDIHAININQIIPFYNPSNTPFNHNQSSRKSFTRGNHKLRLSIGNTSSNGNKDGKNKIHHQDNLNDNNGTANTNPDGQLSPQANISFEMIDEEDDDETIQNGYPFDNKRDNYLFNSLSTSPPSTSLQQSLQSTQISSNQKLPTTDNYKFNSFGDNNKLESSDSDMFIDNYTSDLDYYPMRSSPGSSNVVEPEREDFPVNNAQPPDYAPKLDQLTKTSATKTKFNLQIQQRRAAAATTDNSSSSRSSMIATSTQSQTQRKLSSVTSVSTVDLHRIDDSMVVTRKPIARNGSPVRSYNAAYNKIKKSDTTSQLNKENNIRNNRRITVQIMAPPIKPPARSKTSIDLRGASTTTGPISGPTTPISPISNPRNIHFQSQHTMADENTEINILTAHHDSVYHELSNRYAILQLIRNSMRSNDVSGALKQAIKLNDRSVLVDLLGAILEKSNVWNLDMCLLLLPELYEMIQSQHKFHCTRACDTLRIIISNYLPIIQDNVDPWASRSLSVDVQREDRQQKCIECRNWLLRIKSLPENSTHIGVNLVQLQNLIVDL